MSWAHAGAEKGGSSPPAAAAAAATVANVSTSVQGPKAVEWHVQLRRRDGKFTSVYRGTDHACQISGLNMGTLYEVRLVMIFAWASAPESSSGRGDSKLFIQAMSASRFFLTSPQPPSILGSSLMATTFAWEPVSKCEF